MVYRGKEISVFTTHAQQVRRPDSADMSACLRSSLEGGEEGLPEQEAWDNSLYQGAVCVTEKLPQRMRPKSLPEGFLTSILGLQFQAHTLTNK